MKTEKTIRECLKSPKKFEYLRTAICFEFEWSNILKNNETLKKTLHITEKNNKNQLNRDFWYALFKELI